MGRLHRNFFGILKFLERPKAREIKFKYMVSSEEGQLLAGAFHVIIDKIETDIL